MANIGTASAAQQGTLWGAHPRDWAEHEERRTAQLVADVLDALAIGDGTTLLDAGCGAGMAALEAARRGARVTGLDASAAMIEVAAARAPQCRFEVGDIEHLPAQDGAFDVTVAFNAVFYCADIGRGMRELARVTRPGGKVAVTAWGRAQDCDLAAMFGALFEALPFTPAGPGPFALAAPGALEELLGTAKLQPTMLGASRCVLASPSWEVCWRGFRAAGPIQAAIGALGVDAVEAIARRAVAPFTDAHGVIEMTNTFVWAIGERS